MIPLRRGNFSAIHIATTPDARPYGDAEFAFKGARNHLRWWFRKPAFKHDLIDMAALASEFPSLKIRKDGEVTIDIETLAEADALILILGRFFL